VAEATDLTDRSVTCECLSFVREYVSFVCEYDSYVCECVSFTRGHVSFMRDATLVIDTLRASAEAADLTDTSD